MRNDVGTKNSVNNSTPPMGRTPRSLLQATGQEQILHEGLREGWVRPACQLRLKHYHRTVGVVYTWLPAEGKQLWRGVSGNLVPQTSTLEWPRAPSPGPCRETSGTQCQRAQSERDDREWRRREDEDPSQQGQEARQRIEPHLVGPGQVRCPPA